MERSMASPKQSEEWLTLPSPQRIFASVTQVLVAVIRFFPQAEHGLEVGERTRIQVAQFKRLAFNVGRMVQL
ncbi:hypothetical protein D3C72_709050 [compost metagenome]